MANVLTVEDSLQLAAGIVNFDLMGMQEGGQWLVL